jgi:spermidine synthase
VIDQEGWFSEVLAEKGSAFSLRTCAKLHEEQSPYQQIEIYATETFGNLMVIDGSIMLTSRDNFFYHEMMSHPALFSHPAPKRICIVGGGDCGTLQEVLRHSEVEQVTQVDIDERVTRLAERYFPELTAGNRDPRARLLFDDGIAWVANADPGTLDIIIVDSTDPVGPAVGLFTQPFFESCLRALAAGGILIQQSESPLLHLDILRRMVSDMRVAGFADVKSLFFPQCVYPSGWWSATMARKGEAISDFRIEAVERRPFATRYYNADIHRAALAQPEFFRREIAAAD